MTSLRVVTFVCVTTWLLTLNNVSMTLEAHVQCDDAAHGIYVDGQYVGSTSVWYDVWTADLADDAKLIAIDCYNDESDGGLIASFGNGLTTDVTWRCSGDVIDGWYDVDFDDGHWDMATIRDTPGDYQTSFPDYAKWIWKTGEFSDNSHSYCRGRLQPVVTINAFCHNVGTVYVDGENVGETNEESLVRHRTQHPRLLAVQCVKQTGITGGLLVSLSNGFLSDGDWKSRNSPWNGWYRTSYDDTSGWESPRLIGSNDDRPNNWEKMEGFADDAQWIWSGHNRETRARRILGISVSIRCDDNCTVYADGVKMFGGGNYYGMTIIPRATRVVAVRGGNGRGDAYIVAGFSNGFRTVDGRDAWKCSDQEHTGWTDVGYDDSDWPHASSYGWDYSVRFVYWAKKIWTSEVKDDSYVYCRGHMECGCDYRCEPDVNGYDFKCICQNGYLLGEDGFSCVVDSCAQNENACSHHCTNTHDSYECSCRNGYELDADKHSCNNINECNKRTDNCSEDCVDTEGGFQCDCSTGRELQDDLVTCQDIDECSTTTHGCSHGCNNTEGSYTCLCSTGYRLLADRKTCEDIDECEEGTHICTSQNMTCTNTAGGFQCGCVVGYLLKLSSFDAMFCEDIDECQTGISGCSHSCTNTVGSYECYCSDGTAQGSSRCKGDNSSNIGMLAGVSVAVVLLVICVVILAVLFVRRRRRKKERGDATDELNHGSTATGHTSNVYYNAAAEVRTIHQEETPYAVVDEPARVPAVTNEAASATNGAVQGSSADGPGAHTYYNVGREFPPPVTETATSDPQYAVVNKPKLQKRPGAAASLHKDDELSMETRPPSLSTEATSPSAASKPKAVPKPTPRKKPDVPPPPIARATSTDEGETHSQGADNVYGNMSTDELLSKPIRVQELGAEIRRMQGGGNFYQEFNSIPSGQKGRCVACDRDGIKERLRFQNIKPYDHSIVKLSEIEGEPLSDFINANFIDGYKKPNYYIATQGPKPITLVNFWRMLWEQHVGIVVMVTTLYEGAKEKCTKYWGDSGVKQFGSISVRVDSEEVLAEFTLRTFLVQKGDEKRTLKHFHYTTWPDKSVPQNGASLLEFRRRIKQEEKSVKPPVVVHCSAGVGRTGAYIAIDYLLEQAEVEGRVDVVACVNSMRENRMDMVQSTIQYSFVHTTVLEALHVGNTSIPCPEFDQRLTFMRQMNPGTKLSEIQRQFKLLDSIKPDIPESSYEEARLPENIPKNRDPSILPADRSRIFLQPSSGMSSDYINAIFVDGYKSKRDFIVTQMPLGNTRIDLWRMVQNFNISTIVMLNQVESDDDGIYFPAERGECINLGQVTIKTKEVSGNPVVVRDVEVQTPSRSMAVSHVCMPGWSSCDDTSSSALIALFKEVQKLKESQSRRGPVLVHCLDGVERSGLFVATYLLLEKMNAEQVVDVFSVVKTIRAERPQFITTEDQYNLLHTVAKEFIDNYAVYANFK